MTRFSEIPIIHRAVRMPATWRLVLLQRLARAGVREETLLIVLSVIIGLGGGLAAWVFKWWVDFLQRNFYEASVARLHATVFLFFLPLVPAFGGLLMSFSRLIFRTANSPFHGLSGVMLSLIRTGGKLPHKTGLETLIASGLTIGSGGSAGPEAPIAIIGSSLGSSIGALAGISRRNLPTLVGCGAAAGIGAVFDAPLAGVLFALEVMLRDFSVRTFMPIVVSAVIATTMFHSLLAATGVQPMHGLFEMPADKASAFLFTFRDLPNYVLLGLFCGLTAIAFTYCLRLVEKQSEKMEWLPRIWKPAIGAGLSGVCGAVLILLFRHDTYVAHHFAEKAYVPIFADGYSTILRAIDPSWYDAGGAHQVNGQAVWLGVEFLAAVCIFKIVATALTLGSGGSGGVFAPALFIGASAGGLFGILLSHILPGPAPSAYALVGMGAVLAAVIQAPLMSILLLFDITRNYQVMLPIMLTAVIATLMYQFVFGESLYTLPLAARGIRVGAAAGMSVLRRIGVEQLTLDPLITAQAGEPVSAVLQRTQNSPQMDFVVVDDKGRYLGILSTAELHRVLLQPEAAPLLLVGDVCRSDVPPLLETETLETAMELFARLDIECLAVIRKEPQEKLVGMLSRADAMKQYHRALG